MLFDVARHKLFEAVITLSVLALAMALSGILLADGSTTFSGGAPLGVLIDNFQHEHYILATIVGFVLSVHLCFGLTRATVRSHLYGANSFAMMSVLPLVLLLFATMGYTLLNVVIASLSCEALRRILYAFSSDRRQQAIFTAMFALGLMPLIEGSLFIIVCLSPLILVSLRCSARETIVGVVGVLLPMFIYSYIVWFCGGEFMQCIASFYERMLLPSSESITAMLSIPHLVACGILVLLSVGSVVLFLRDRMSMTLAARHAWRFILSAILLLAMSFVVLPSASVTMLLLLAMVLSLIVPILLLRLSTPLAMLAYLIMLGCGIAVL